MTKEALKLALEALEAHADIGIKSDKAITAIKEVLAQPEYQSTADKTKLEKVPAKGTLLAQPEQTNIERHEANVQKFLGAPQPEQEPVAWRFTGIAGLKRYMTQKHYDAQTPEIKKWYEPFKCKNCTTPPQPEQEPVAWWNQKKDSVSIDPVHRHNPDCQPLYTAPPQPEPLIDEQVDDEFKLYASLFDTSGDKWLDMDAYDYFKAGFKAAHGIKENT